MKRLFLGLALAVGLLAACSPGATPSVRVVTPEPSLPGASLPAASMATSPGASGLFASPSKTP